MSLPYALTFLILAALAGAAAVAGRAAVGPAGLAFAYPALAFLALAVAYAGAGPGTFLKRTDGRRSPWAWVYLGPYFLLNAVVFSFHRILGHGPAYAEIVPNLWFGRRLTAREARDAEPIGWGAVLDLAPEFAEVRPLRELPGYRSLPVLDATAPAEDDLRHAVTWLADRVKTGPVFVHCALGHGRTGCVVAAFLIATGVVPTAATAVRLLRELRPGVRLNPAQRRAVKAFETRPGEGGYRAPAP